MLFTEIFEEKKLILQRRKICENMTYKRGIKRKERKI